MPLYTYKCNDCEHIFETRQRMTDEPLADCPVCDGPIRRIINSVGVVFKGSGFYVTDNRNGNNGASKSTGKAATEDSNSSTSSDSTPTTTKSETTEKAASTP